MFAERSFRFWRSFFYISLSFLRYQERLRISLQCCSDAGIILFGLPYRLCGLRVLWRAPKRKLNSNLTFSMDTKRINLMFTLKNFGRAVAQPGRASELADATQRRRCCRRLPTVGVPFQPARRTTETGVSQVQILPARPFQLVCYELLF